MNENGLTAVVIVPGAGDTVVIGCRGIAWICKRGQELDTEKEADCRELHDRKRCGCRRRPVNSGAGDPVAFICSKGCPWPWEGTAVDLVTRPSMVRNLDGHRSRQP